MTHQIDPTAFQAVIADLHQRLATAHQDRQRLLHENERLRAQVKHEVIAATQTWGLEVHCDGKCGVSPLRIKVAPPEDAVALWVQGHGWKTDAECHWCPRCAP